MNKLKGPFLQLVILSISVLLIVVAAGTVWITWNKYKNKISEQAILKEFYAHVKNNPNIIVRRFQLWEGKGIADIDIKGKGLANIWYGKDSVPVISSIGGYSTSYECFYVDNNNNKKEYAYTVELDLRNGSDFNRWFPLGVNSLQDLASNYDSITAILKTFPVNPDVVPFKDASGERFIRKVPDENFILNMEYKNKQVQCDLYHETIPEMKENSCIADSDCTVVSMPESDNKCCSGCDSEAISKSELSKRDDWRTRNCQNEFSMCTVNDCYNEQIPVAACISGRCELQWKNR